MKALGIYGSPRADGNSDILLDRVLEGASSEGMEIGRLYVRDYAFSPCTECGGCDETGRCIIDDAMQGVYTRLLESEIVFLASPVFFYGLTAQAKALVDRCQALWRRRMLTKSREERKRFDGGVGYLLMTAAAESLKVYECGELTAKYFFYSLDKSYGGGFFARAEKKGEILEKPGELERAFRFGKAAVTRIRPL